jgi:hypothetical protein
MSNTDRIVFLDFDKTLTDIHTAGFPNCKKSYWRTNVNKEHITNLLTQLKTLGVKLYIVTRADEELTIDYVQLHFPNMFDSVIGNTSHNVALMGCNDISWAKWKLDKMKKILSNLNHTDISKVHFFDDTQVNIDIAQKEIPNSYKVDYESTHLFELLSENVLPLSEVVYNVPVYDIDKIYPDSTRDESIKYILRKSRDRTTELVITNNPDYNILNVFTAVYTTSFKELFGVVNENGTKRFVRFTGDKFNVDNQILSAERFRSLDDFLNYVHNLLHIDCTEHKLDDKQVLSFCKFI